MTSRVPIAKCRTATNHRVKWLLDLPNDLRDYAVVADADMLSDRDNKHVVFRVQRSFGTVAIAVATVYTASDAVTRVELRRADTVTPFATLRYDNDNDAHEMILTFIRARALDALRTY